MKNLFNRIILFLCLTASLSAQPSFGEVFVAIPAWDKSVVYSASEVQIVSVVAVQLVAFAVVCWSIAHLVSKIIRSFNSGGGGYRSTPTTSSSATPAIEVDPSVPASTSDYEFVQRTLNRSKDRNLSFVQERIDAQRLTKADVARVKAFI